MGYQRAMEAAGATVHCFESFGSYQGDWWAKVTYNGITGWVNGSYGSCSGCDAFEAEFGWGDEDPEKLKAFGEGYLDNILPQHVAETRAGENSGWDSDAPKMVQYIKENL